MPDMGASVRTLVVSWNDAAARNGPVFNEALVTPSSTGSAVAGPPPCGQLLMVMDTEVFLARRSTG
jgi:hypothetical protein